MPTWGEAADILMAIAIMATVYVQLRHGRKLEVVHKATNSMHDEIVSLTKAQGIAEGKAEQKAYDKKTS